MTRVPRGGGSQEGTTGDLLSHQPEFMGTPLNYYKLRESLEKSPEVYGAGQDVPAQPLTSLCLRRTTTAKGHAASAPIRVRKACPLERAATPLDTQRLTIPHALSK